MNVFSYKICFILRANCEPVHFLDRHRNIRMEATTSRKNDKTQHKSIYSVKWDICLDEYSWCRCKSYHDQIPLLFHWLRISLVHQWLHNNYPVHQHHGGGQHQGKHLHDHYINYWIFSDHSVKHWFSPTVWRQAIVKLLSSINMINS